MKKTRKCLSMLLAGVIASSAVPAAFAASDSSFAQPCVVDYFNSFNGFSKAKDEKVNDVLKFVEGFDANNLRGLAYRTGGLQTVKSAGGNTYLNFGIGGAKNHSGMMMKFDETITSGKLRVSFDLKINDTEKFNQFRMRAIDTAGSNGNNNVDDWMVPNGSGGSYESNTQLLELVSGNKLKLAGQETNYTLDNIGNTWHKYEFVFDFDTAKVDFRLDMNDAVTKSMGSKFKTLDFQMETLGDPNQTATTPIYMDNLFIKHYPDGELSAPETIVDYDGISVPNNDAVVYASFSEALTIVNGSAVALPEDFEAVNVVSGDTIPAKNVTKEDGAMKLTFKSLPTGTYKIRCVSGDYKSAAGTNPEDSNTFSTVGAAQNVKAENVLVADNFENYNGGMPANAVSTSLDKTYAGSLTAVAGKTGNAVALSGARDQLIYKLPYAVTSGKVTYEFDIKHSGGNWFTGIIGAEGFETDTISASIYGIAEGKTAPNTVAPLNSAWKSNMTEEEAANWANIMKGDQNWLRKATVAVGCANNSPSVTDNTTAVQAGLNKGDTFNNVATDNPHTNTVNGLELPKDTWQHVKVEVDMDNAYYNITVGETTKTFKIYENRLRGDTRYRYRTLSNGTQKWVKCVTPGIQGISLGHFNDENSTVAYDNFKVYTDNSYIDYSDFNTAGTTATNTIAEYKNYPPAGWLKPNRYQNMTTQFAEAVGKTGTATDKSMQITGNDAWTHKFSRPIEVGTPFEIEFDIKTTTGTLAAEKTTWHMTLNTQRNLYKTFEGVGTNSTDTFEGIAYDANLDKGLNDVSVWDAANKVSRESSGWCVLGAKNDASDNIKLCTAIGYVGYLHADGGNTIAAKGQDWHHVKLCVDPSSGSVKVKAYLDEVEISAINANYVPANEEFVGLGFVHDDASYSSCIDNLTVRETTAAAINNVYVTDANAVSISNGEKTPLSDGLAAKGETVEINFSAPIASADAIKLYKNTDSATTEVTVTKTLSNGNKTLSVTLPDDLAVGDKYVFEIPHSIKPQSGSNLSYVDATAVAFEITEAAPAEIKVEEFRLYKYYADGGNYSSSATSVPCWAPATAKDVENATSEDQFKFIAKGYNTGKEENLRFIRAFKETDSRLRSAAISDITLDQYGTFEKDTAVFTITETDGVFDAYLWELTTLMPAYNKFNAQLKTTQE